MRVFANQEQSAMRHRTLAPRRGPSGPRRSGSVAYSAMGRPTTRRAFRRHGLRALAVLATGAALWAATGLVIELAPDTTDAPVQVIALALVTAGAVAVAGGLAALIGWSRMGWVLRTHPWTVWESTPVPAAAGGRPRGTTVRLGPDGEHHLVLVTYGELPEHFADAGVVWLAGSPDHGGVLSPDGGAHLAWCRPADR